MANPYDDDYPVLSREEMRLILMKVRVPKATCFMYLHKGNTRISLVDCAKANGVRRHALAAIISGKQNLASHEILHKKRIRPLSRWLVMYECGMITKAGGVLTYLTEPTKAMPAVMRLQLTAAGPKMIKATARAAPSLMPSFKAMFGTMPDLPLPKRG